jgi:hypothetical protein
MEVICTTRRPLVGDEQLDEWLPLLTAWWRHFRDEPVTVDELRISLSLDVPGDAVVIPTSLMRPRRKGPGALKRSLGRRLAALVGWTIGPFIVCDGGRDTRHNVRVWRLRCIWSSTQQGADQ